MKIFLSILFSSLLFLSNAALAEVPAAMLQTGQNSVAQMLKKVMPAVVNIYAEGDAKSANSPFAEGENAPTRNQHGKHFVSIGSGVIVDASHGYILTNAHVVFDADNVTVTLNDGRRFKAKPVGMDTGFDIALLQINAKNLTAVPLGNSSKLEVGDFVTAIGSPFNLKQTVTSGIVSALHRSIHIEGNEDFIQTDASINVGSSGGALVNMQGQLVGINTAILAPDGGNVGIGFAIPIDLVHHVMNELLQYGKLQRGMLGVFIQNLTPDLAESFKSPVARGALVSQVNPGSPAMEAGLQDGDIIDKVNDMRIDNSSEMRNQISLMRPGSKVTLGVIRNGKQTELHATVANAKTFKAHENALSQSLLTGVTLQKFDQQTLHFGHVEGVQVGYVDPNSDAWSAMLRPGDVIVAANQQNVKSIPALEKVVKSNDKRLLLHVMRQDGAFYIVIP